MEAVAAVATATLVPNMPVSVTSFENVSLSSCALGLEAAADLFENWHQQAVAVGMAPTHQPAVVVGVQAEGLLEAEAVAVLATSRTLVELRTPYLSSLSWPLGCWTSKNVPTSATV